MLWFERKGIKQGLVEDLKEQLCEKKLNMAKIRMFSGEEVPSLC